MKYLKLVITTIVFITIAALSAQIISKSKQNQKYKLDLSEVNHFKYGMFSVDTWKQQLTVIIHDEIDNLSITPQSERALQKSLQKQLAILFDKVMERIEKSNSETTEGRIKLTIMDSFVDRNEIKKGIPTYAKAMMKELKSDSSQKMIRNLLREKIGGYLQESFDAAPDNTKNQIIVHYRAKSEEEVRSYLENSIAQNQKHITLYMYIIIAIAVLVFVIEGFNKKSLPPSQYILLTLTLISLMFVGVSTPMIDMEAKISELSFVLFGHPIVFKDQVLFFQSKSIMDVFHIMITHKELQMKLVGILVVSFSVVFPIFKTLSSLVYYYDYCNGRKNKLVKFFVEKSGKWSMADVLVVAIFMAYIGFNGIINSQMEKLREAGSSVEVITTNGTSLQPGYYLFLTYTILAMFLAGFIKARPYQCVNEEFNTKKKEDENEKAPHSEAPAEDLSDRTFHH